MHTEQNIFSKVQRVALEKLLTKTTELVLTETLQIL